MCVYPCGRRGKKKESIVSSIPNESKEKGNQIKKERERKSSQKRQRTREKVDFDFRRYRMGVLVHRKMGLKRVV